MMRHLIYHCCPLEKNDLWLRNLEQLFARWHVFNGKRVVAVSTGHKCWQFERVWQIMQSMIPRDDRGQPITYIQVPNDMRLREVASFRKLLEAVEGRRADSAVFYAHTKGNSTYDDERGALYWRNMMYFELLDRYESCMRWLNSGYHAVGCNKICWRSDQRPPYPSGLMHGTWMFAGTFFWFRAESVFTRRWDRVPNDRYGAEAWLSGMFEPHEVKSVFQPWPEKKYPSPSPYDPDLYARYDRAIEDIELKHPSYCI